ncbi:hypothetical protein FKR81_05295 [Lentzea tibetensis]|uniref:Tetracycline repressor TetR C-terminal domain-containing protein n=1 Tax=Lentzea tibetensis TaxID=2591470 RepID=A0A563F087_9PSEU|nr:TetR/AcrR family transcriptional regulator C-terminal domain-containing protein [Lentzea tibetensis]TWP53380.1 hypothetical protein FKR81_05295 [Lentzea tibetensis]
MALDRDGIARAALTLIDSGEPFSMRKLGASLGVDPMAVYRHYADQEDLFDGVAEALFAAADVDSLRWDEWRPMLFTYCRRLLDVLLAHPRAVTVFATRPVRSPEAIACGNRMIGVLRDAGFDPPVALQMTRCLREYTIGHALSVVPPPSRRSRKPRRGSPGYDLLAASADGAPVDAHFELGLNAMLQGFSAM